MKGGQMNKSLVYLATPYSHPDRAVRVQRFEIANRVAAEMMRAGIHVFSPISHTHPIAEAGELPKGWEYWEAYDRAILVACVEVCVLQQNGWEESIGVTAEIAIAKEMGLPITYREVRMWTCKWCEMYGVYPLSKADRPDEEEPVITDEGDKICQECARKWREAKRKKQAAK